ncbi:MAG: NHL repeat-containing protein [Dehalococcoidia bacterium]
MLTTSIKGRALDYSRVVGGRLFRGIVNVTIGEKDDVYVVLRDSYNAGIVKLEIGNAPDDESEILSFNDTSPGIFDSTWPACAVFYKGEIFVTDELNSEILVFTPEGKLLRKFGSKGDTTDKLDRPSGISFNTKGQILVSDTMNHRIQIFDIHGKHISSFGREGSNDGELLSPWGITTDDADNIFVSDHLNHRIQKFDNEGNFIFSFGNIGTGHQNLNHPSDVTVDPAGDIYVADWANNRIQIYGPDGYHIGGLKGSAYKLSKWQEQYVQGNPDVYKARRRVVSLEPEKFFALPTCVLFDGSKSRLLSVDSQRWRIQIYDKLENYSDPQFNI